MKLLWAPVSSLNINGGIIKQYKTFITNAGLMVTLTLIRTVHLKNVFSVFHHPFLKKELSA